ncbi:hypothetical protein CHH91_04610 [Virgibacillus sp. 7505]|uniref:hypothetical protein n=1 Tax=Virgibacillus sp. 7505 TaxID=2022548 RepID=UPI000BA69E8D|nr:hypothetical protein [Virgibacillus sp. 7505]PAE17291.1 hypothetical protein CHH91_04610 [Virgibacillus sp. 7505]
MIQEYLMNRLAAKFPGLTWTTSFYTNNDNTGTIYYEGGSKPSTYEDKMRYPRYMIWLRSSKWAYLESLVDQIHEELHEKGNFTVAVPLYDEQERQIGEDLLHVYFIEAASDPNRIGVQDDVMEYSLNFDVTLKKVRGGILDGNS